MTDPIDCSCHVRGDMEIIYCPLHAAAPDLLITSRALALACLPSIASKYGVRMPERELVDAAREAVRKAEGS